MFSGYKVCKRHRGKLYSVVSSHAGNGRNTGGWNYTIEYTPGRWTRPTLRGSRLFYFKELQDARNFMMGDLTLSVWSCWVVGSKEIKSIVPPISVKYNADLKLAWQNLQDHFLHY